MPHFLIPAPERASTQVCMKGTVKHVNSNKNFCRGGLTDPREISYQISVKLPSHTRAMQRHEPSTHPGYHWVTKTNMAKQLHGLKTACGDQCQPWPSCASEQTGCLHSLCPAHGRCSGQAVNPLVLLLSRARNGRNWCCF